MSSEPNDEVVEHAIQSALSTMSTSVRPNKLRKIICKQLPATNWTQYQRVLDSLVENKCVHLQEINGEKLIVVSQTGNSQSAIGTNVELTQTVDGNTRALMTDREEIQVPFEIFLHLTKKGRKKQKNIETNTKTKITFHNEKSDSNKIRSEDNLKGSSCTVIITKAYSTLEDGGKDEKEAKEKAQKQIKAAKLYITKMIQSFEKNPDHFIPSKAGGTFAEQAEAKKRKSEVVALMNKKKKSAGSSKQNLSTSDSSDKVENDNGVKTKKARRKYY